MSDFGYSEIEYLRDLGALMYSPGDWIQLPRILIKSMEPRESILLSELLSIASMKIKAQQSDGVWFRCTDAQIKKGIGYSKNQIYRGMEALEEKGFIRRRRNGYGGKRFIFISLPNIFVHLMKEDQSYLEQRLGPSSFKKMAKLVKKGIRSEKSGVLRSGKSEFSEVRHWDVADVRGPIRIRPSIRKKSITHCPDCAGTDWDSSFVTPFRKAVDKSKTIPHTTRVDKWVTSFRLLHQRDGVSMKDLHRVFKWYCREISDKDNDVAGGNPNYIPVARSGKVFREKFDRITVAMDKTKRGKGPKKIKFTSKKLSKKAAKKAKKSENYYADDY